MSWANPEWFWALLLLPLLIGLQVWYHRSERQAAVTFSSNIHFGAMPGNLRARWGPWVGYTLQMIALVLLIAALARPQVSDVAFERDAEGIDIMLVLDISSSMLAEDLQPNRLEAVKQVASRFVDAREDDRIGLVVFARHGITLSPLTMDHYMLQNHIDQVDPGMVQDGTAIGMGLASAINRLRHSDAESRVIILLTDGENNAGEIDPLTAGQMATSLDMRVYTIGASADGQTAPYPVEDPVFGERHHQVPIAIDEQMMTRIAEQTGGRYFRATDNESLQQVYDEIDRMERSPVEEAVYTEQKDIYARFMLPAIVLLVLSVLCNKMLLRFEPA